MPTTTPTTTTTTTPTTTTAPSSETATAGTAGTSASRPPPTSHSSAPRLPTQVLASHLDVPWAVAFLPDGSALVTLRNKAQVLQLRAGAAPLVLATIAGVHPLSEGGLLGIAVSPTFARDHRVFVYFTAAADNRVVRLVLAHGRLTDPVPVLTGIRKAGNHNGGRLAFGPDGDLYVTTGDATDRPLAQQRGSLNGKILRITQDGRPAPGNPFGASPVWSYGHRNVQGIAWTPDGRMYASEFGQDTWDELNLIQPGRNYGWPVVEGRGGQPGFVDPVAQWPTSQASPSGIAVAAGAIWMTALRGESLWRIPLTSNGIGTPRRLLAGTYGRLRDAVAAPDGRLWILTSNTFRGTPGPQDDRVVALDLADLR
ncbi:sorbosone dehydrogenase family protein [Nostocoides sp. HKS02]|uniref:PQQ-dependent sugar dehydrogenase n=1 Tax=Nostocoides sp. HKS02 TaxID=1813880 RepID=UPI001E28F09A|nr:PQQ-dependent sugar dehydrogenase [Tetrasphaera sp. HKS02]